MPPGVQRGSGFSVETRAERLAAQREQPVEEGSGPVTVFGTALARNSALNLAGILAPLVAAVVAIPALIGALGTERVGFLTLAWGLIGYLSLFDLGIGRALTLVVARRLADGDGPGAARAVWTGTALMGGLGTLAGAATALSARWIVTAALRIPAALQHEAVQAVWILAITVPLVVVTAGFRGVLEARGRFLTANAIRAPLGVWLSAGPLLIVPFGSTSLAWVAVVLLIGRLVAGIAFAVTCFRGIPGRGEGPAFDHREARQLLRLGGWMTVSNVVSPILVYMDRFLVGNRISLEAVAWYATPWEVVTKVLILPVAIVGALFPAFGSLAAVDSIRATALYRRSVTYTALLLFPPTFAISLFAREGLQLWLGAEFASNGARVAQIIALGSLLNGVATVPFALLQGLGRPDLTAKVHVVELPIYVALVIGLTAAFGIQGTAAAWTGRVALDLLALLLLARLLTHQPVRPRRRALFAAGGSLTIFAASFLSLPVEVKAVLLGVVVALAGAGLRRAIVTDRLAGAARVV